jgi:TonB family protein
VPPVLAQEGISGTAVIEILVAPNGHVISAKVHTSSGISLIDQVALQHAQSAVFPPFNDEMPQVTRAFLIPIEIQPDPNQ